MVTRAEEFMKAMHGIPANHVMQAVTALTPGISWVGCSKSYVAEACDGHRHANMATFDIQCAARMARARWAGDPDWAEKRPE